MALQTAEVRKTLTKAIADTIEFKTGWRIAIESLHGLLPLEARAKHAALSRGGKVFYTCDEVEFVVSPLDLFYGTLGLSHIKMTGIKGENTLNHLDEMIFTGEVGFSLITQKIHADFHIETPEEDSTRVMISANREEWTARVIEGERGITQKLISSSHSAPYTASVYGSFEKSDCTARLQCPSYDLDLVSAFSLDSANRIELTSIEGYASDHDLALDGMIAIDFMSQTVAGEMELSPLPCHELSGIIEASLWIEGPLIGPKIKVAATSPHLSWEDTSLDKLTLECLCTPVEGEIETEWTVAGKVNSIPVQITSHAHFAQSVDVTQFHAAIPSGTLSGRGHFGENSLLHIEGNLQDLQKLGVLFPFPIEGAVLFEGDLSPKGHRFTVKGREVLFGDAFYEKFTLQQEGPSSDRFNAALSAQHVMWEGIIWEELSFGTSVDLDCQTWPFTLMATGPDEQTMQVNASGQWHFGGEEMFVHIGLLSGTLFHHPFDLTKPFNCVASKTTTRTSQIQLRFGEGTAAFEGTLDEQEINCFLECQQCPVDCVNGLLPYNLEMRGTGSLFLRLTGTLSDIQGSMAVKGNEIILNDESHEQLPFADGKMEAVLANNQLTFEGKAVSLHNPVHISGVIPFVVSLNSLRAELPSQEPIRAHLSTSGEISPYLKLFMTDMTSVEGRVEVDVDIGGTVEHPVVEGRAHLRDGLFESLNTGLVVRDIECLLIGNEKKLYLKYFKANDGGEGTLSAQGQFELDQKRQYPFALHVDLDQAMAVRLDYADMATSGTVKLAGNISGAKVTGDVTCDQVNIQIPDKLPTQVTTVGVTFINEEEVITSHSEKSKDAWPIELDVNFSVPSKFYVFGRDLESEWRGNFSFGGTTLDPKVYGTLELIRGEYSFNGKSFTSTQGSVNFAGEAAAKTTIYVVGEQQIDNIKVHAILKGDIQAPSLSFRSNPSMSEKEILSWILFGHGIDEITPYQKEQLSESVFTLSSGEDSDVISKLRSDMGIDRLDISNHATDERNELSLRIGKYISRGIYVSLSKSINAEANQVAIEANVTRHLKVQAEVGDNAEGKMSLKWARDY